MKSRIILTIPSDKGFHWIMEAPKKLFVNSKVRLQLHIKLQSMQSGVWWFLPTRSFTEWRRHPQSYCPYQSQIATSYQVTVYAIWIVIMIPPDTEFHRMMKAPTKLSVKQLRLQLHIQLLDEIWMYSTMSRLRKSSWFHRIDLSVLFNRIFSCNRS